MINNNMRITYVVCMSLNAYICVPTIVRTEIWMQLHDIDQIEKIIQRFYHTCKRSVFTTIVNDGASLNND